MQKVKVVAASEQQLPVVQRLEQLYCYDFSQWQRALVPNNNGLFTPTADNPALESYWHHPERYAFTIWNDNALAGFALVDERCVDQRAKRQIAQFFVLRSYRQSGVGAAAAAAIVKRFRCEWEIFALVDNKPAVSFWRNTVAEISQGNYRQFLENDGYYWRFSSRPAR